MVNSEPEVILDNPNEYSYNNDYIYVQKSKDFVPFSKQDLLNIFYSILDNGYETFTFYCPNEYSNCIDDVEELSKSENIMTDIGNFVHPYNNFTNLKIVTDSLGEVDVIIERIYTKEMKNTINKKIDEIFKEVITDNMDINDRILKIHDYIIDHASYDMEDGENSGNAYGALIEGKAKCAGYADAMAIILAKLNVKNYKVASSKHVWNAVNIDNSWSQLDLTWDDPIVQDGAVLTDTIRHKFYMIDTETLHSYDTLEHDFDKKIYIELK